MEIVLKPDLAEFVDEQVRAGRFYDASAVVNGALEALRDIETLSPEDLERVKREVAVGIRQADRGQFAGFTANDIKSEGRSMLSRRNGT